MRSAEGLAINHGQPVRWNLARLHPRCVHIPRIDPEPELQSHGVYGIRKILEAVREFFFALLIVAESIRPVVHAGNDRCSLIPGRIVVEDIESHSLRQIEFLKERLFAIFLGEPDAISNQRRVWKGVRKTYCFK